MLPSPIANMIAADAVFTVIALQPGAYAFNVTFTSTIRRFKLSSTLATTGAGVQVAPLKKVALVPPTSGTSFINVAQSFSLELDALPAAGSTLVCSITYEGASSNIDIPKSVEWTSTSTLKKVVAYTGLSHTDFADIVLTFSGDASYNLTTRRITVLFVARLRVDVQMPSSAFAQRGFDIFFTLPQAQAIFIYPTVTPSDRFKLGAVRVPFSRGASVVGSVNVIPQDTAQSFDAVFSFSITGPDVDMFSAMSSQSIVISPAQCVLIYTPSNK